MHETELEKLFWLQSHLCLNKAVAPGETSPQWKQASVSAGETTGKREVTIDMLPPVSLLFLCVLLLLCFQMSAEASTSIVKHGGESVVRLLRNERIDALSERERHATQQRGCCNVAIERLSHCVDCSKNCVEL